MKSKFTVSIATSAEASFSSVHMAATYKMDALSTRTFSNGRFVLQAKHTVKHKTVLVSNAWKLVEDDNAFENPQSKLMLPYEVALSLLLHSKAEMTAHAFKLDPHGYDNDHIEIIKAATGHDLLYPRPSAQGKVSYTLEGLQSMHTEQLKELDQRTPGQVHGVRKKEDYVKHLAQKLLDTDSSTVINKKRKRETVPKDVLDDEFHRFCPASSDQDRIYQQYSKSYGWQDQFNARYYQVFSPSSCQSASKLCIMSLLLWQVINSHAAFLEYRSGSQSAQAGGKAIIDCSTKSEGLATFIFNLAGEIVAL